MAQVSHVVYFFKKVLKGPKVKKRDFKELTLNALI